jgi:nitrite reductase/ring-hydroxylating ferredoxin subunit
MTNQVTDVELLLCPCHPCRIDVEHGQNISCVSLGNRTAATDTEGSDARTWEVGVSRLIWGGFVIRGGALIHTRRC